MLAEGWIGGCVAVGAPQQCTHVGEAGRMQLGHEWEQHLSILIFLLQLEMAFSAFQCSRMDGQPAVTVIYGHRGSCQGM